MPSYKIPVNCRGSRWAVGLGVAVLAFLCQEITSTLYSVEATDRPPSVDELITQLHTPDGKAELLYPPYAIAQLFHFSPPMKQLVERGTAIQPRLLVELRNVPIRNEIITILSRIGDKEAVPHLIEALPKSKELTEDEEITARCLQYALREITGTHLGNYFGCTPKIRARWQGWYKRNKNFLYNVRRRPPNDWHNRVEVDFEAKIAGTPTAVYRQKHPWPDFGAIKTWRDDPAYEKKLKDFCFSVILNKSWRPYNHAPFEFGSLTRIRDPRALQAVHAMCAVVNESILPHSLVSTLEAIGEPSSIPFLEKLPRLENEKDNASLQRKRSRAIERIRLVQKHGKELHGKPLNFQQQTNLMRCLEGPKGVDRLIANLRNRKLDSFLSGYLRVAGYVDQEPIRNCLKQMAGDESRDDRAKTMVHGALARLGEKSSVDYLERALTHNRAGVRLAAAEGLWRLGSRKGFKTLVDILDLRPIETGSEGVRVGNGVLIEVRWIPDSNVEKVRTACKILGEMGDQSAIEPLKRLLPLNLNGIVGRGGSGVGWSGRPDAVALAKLGDFSGITILRESIRNGDPLGVVEDFVAIGLKRFIPELLPLLDDRNEDKRVQAAAAILLLLENGK